MSGEASKHYFEAAVKWAARLGGGIIFVIAILVCGDIFTRNVLNRIVFHAFELSNYLFAIAVAFGLANTLMARAHIRIDVLYMHFPGPLRRIIDSVSLFCVAAVAGLIAVHAWRLVLDNGMRGVTSNSTLGLPLAVPQAAWALGLSFFACVATILAGRHAQLLIKGRPDHADEIGAIGGEDIGTTSEVDIVT